MPEFYPYLVASLPMLQFGARPPFAFDRFIEMCRDMVPAQDLAHIRQCGDDAYLEQDAAHPALAQWQAFETGLRNELAKIRAGRRKIDAHKYLRKSADADLELYHAALASHRMPSPLEAERFLDRQRWDMLDRVAAGHFFDSAALIVYALKLRILLRWDRIARADTQALLERILV
ncbi:MAG: hypothetical protein PHE65_03120 [Candidatus Omnitrophica bacterium]|nr:hypothetical protein [Candidatus Omnitrophota bacterium]